MATTVGEDPGPESQPARAAELSDWQLPVRRRQREGTTILPTGQSSQPHYWQWEHDTTPAQVAAKESHKPLRIQGGEDSEVWRGGVGSLILASPSGSQPSPRQQGSRPDASH